MFLIIVSRRWRSYPTNHGQRRTGERPQLADFKSSALLSCNYQRPWDHSATQPCWHFDVRALEVPTWGGGESTILETSIALCQGSGVLTRDARGLAGPGFGWGRGSPSPSCSAAPSASPHCDAPNLPRTPPHETPHPAEAWFLWPVSRA